MTTTVVITVVVPNAPAAALDQTSALAIANDAAQHVQRALGTNAIVTLPATVSVT